MRLRPVAIFVDTLFKALGSVDSGDDYAEMVGHMDRLTKLAGRTDAAVIALHHNRKAGGGEQGGGVALLGSTAIAGGPDTLIAIDRDKSGDDDTGDGNRWVSSEGRSGVNLKRSLLKLGDDGFVEIGESRSVERIKSARVAVLEAVSDAPGIDHQALLEAVDIKRNDAVKAAKALVSDGLIRQEGKGVKGDPKRYYRG